MTDDRGQALLLVALILGVASAAVVGVRGVSEVVLERARDQRAGEAAVAAAGAAVADLAFARTATLRRELDRAEIAMLVADPVTTGAARAAAERLALLHGRAAPTEVRVLAFGFEIEVHVVMGTGTHVALLGSLP